MNHQEVKKGLLKNKGLQREYARIDLPLEIAIEVSLARNKKKMTQSQLAKKIGTKQPSIARIENGNYLPSLRTMQKIAEALNMEIIPPKFRSASESAQDIDFIANKWEHPSPCVVEKDGYISFVYDISKTIATAKKEYKCNN